MYMKKNYLKNITIVFALTVALFVTGCTSVSSYLKTYNLRCNLNGASYTEEFKEEKKIKSNSYTAFVNLNYYEGAMRILPEANEMIAPTGKVFAGWYFDENFTAESFINKRNLKSRIETLEEKKSEDVYAKWIDENTVDIVIDLYDSTATEKPKFTEEFKTKTGASDYSYIFNLSLDNLKEINEKLPTKDDITHSEDKTFGGFTTIAGSTVPFTQSDLQSKTESLGQHTLKLHVISQDRQYVSIYFYLGAVDLPGEEEFEIPYAKFTNQAIEKYSQNMINDEYKTNNEYGVYYQFYTGTENKLSENIPTKEDMEAYKDGSSDYTTEFSSRTIVGWKIIVFEEDNKPIYVNLTYENIQNLLTEDYGLNGFTAIPVVEVIE